MKPEETVTRTSPKPAGSRPEGWRRRPDPRLPAYLVGGFGALTIAILAGLPELAALGAPFLALTALGLIQREPAGLKGEVTLFQHSVVEGDLVDGIDVRPCTSLLKQLISNM